MSPKCVVFCSESWVGELLESLVVFIVCVYAYLCVTYSLLQLQIYKLSSAKCGRTRSKNKYKQDSWCIGFRSRSLEMLKIEINHDMKPDNHTHTDFLFSDK